MAGCTEIEFAQGDQDKSVTRDVRFVNYVPEEMDVRWISADESIITSVNDDGECRLVWYITTTKDPDDISATIEELSPPVFFTNDGKV